MVADSAAAGVGGRKIGDIYYGVNTHHQLSRSGRVGGRDANGGVVWETVRDGAMSATRISPKTGFRRRLIADLVKLLPINSQL